VSVVEHFVAYVIVPDVGGPVTSAQLSPSTSGTGWHKSDVTVALTATDDSGVQSITYRTHGAQVIGSATVDGDTANVTISNEGETHVFYAATDMLGNVEAEHELVVRIDKTAPAASSLGATYPSTFTLNTTSVPMMLNWSGSDVGSGVRRYQMQQQVNGGTWTSVPLSQSATAQKKLTVSYATSHRFRVRAVDQAGNYSPWAYSRTTKVIVRQDSAQAITYTTPAQWTTQSVTGTFGGTTRFSRTVGATARHSFYGTGIAWVTSQRRDAGIAEIWLDGQQITTVDLYRSYNRHGQVKYVVSGLPYGAHTLEIRVSSSKNAASTGRRIDIDALLVMQ
jgi:hypothetical protein